MTAHSSEGTPLVPLGQGTVQCECPLGVSKEPAHLVFSESKHLEACHDSRQDNISQERTTVTPSEVGILPLFLQLCPLPNRGQEEDREGRWRREGELLVAPPPLQFPSQFTFSQL